MKEGLKIENLSKNFGKIEVIKKISLAVEEGGFLVILGPSGCGKSTLLNIVAGLEKPSSGDVYIQGQNVMNATPRERNIAMVFQSYALYPNMTVAENIAFGLKNKAFDKQALSEKVEKVAARLQISMLLNRKPAELSGGQRQRVAMGRAISRDPSIYLFDEPLSNLDAKLRLDLRFEIKLLHQTEKRTILYVTHDQTEAMTLADKILILNRGYMQQFASPEDVYFYPENLFVAGFIGSPSMNMSDVLIEEKDAAIGFFLAPHNQSKTFIALPKSAPYYKKLSGYLGKTVVFGVRPEHVRIVPSMPSSPEEKQLCVQSEVRSVEFTGAERHVFTLINKSVFLTKLSTVDDTKESLAAIKPGSLILMQIVAERAHFFDKTTEKRIF